MIRVKHILLAILTVAALMLSIAGCENQKATTQKEPQASKKITHSLDKKDSVKLIDEVKKDIALLEKLGEDTSTLEQGFSGHALTNIVNANNADMAAGKLKVRVFKNSKFSYSFAAKNIAAVNWTYVDGSYYIDKTTKQPITSPTKKKQVLNLAVVRAGNRWKIGQIMLPATKESSQTPDEK